jgi:hypothetical protein
MARSTVTPINNSNTLDNRHNQAHAKLLKDKAHAQKCEEDLARLDNELSTYACIGLSKLTESQYCAFQALQDERGEAERHVAKCKSNETEVDYMLDTADIIFQYYDIIENGEENNRKGDGIARQSSMASLAENSILKYFMGGVEAQAEAQPPTQDDSSAMVTPTKPDIDLQNSKNTNSTDRASLLDMYMEKTDPNYFKHSPSENFDKCLVCGTIGKTVLPNDGMCYCNACHAVETLLIDHEKPSYKDPPKEITYFAYKRINHLNEWISQIQGKESTEIPPEIYDKILLEIRKQRITNMADVTNAKIREILKKLGQNRFYEHGAHIMNRLNGMPSISLTPEIEDKLRQMFKMIQIPFFKHAPRNRKNFLSYSYTLHKCLQLLELDEYLKYFPLLKSREKTHAMDEVWKKICGELLWHFYPSV